MEAHMGEAFAGTEHLTVIGRLLHPGEIAPDFCLKYLDLVDMAIHIVRLSDLAGIIRLFSVANSLERPMCQVVTRQWEALRAVLPLDACIYTVIQDPPEMQASFQDRTSVLHQALSAYHSMQFGQDYGVWLKEWQFPQRSVKVIDRIDRIVYVDCD